MAKTKREISELEKETKPQVENQSDKKSYTASKDEKIVEAFVSKRAKEMQDFRKDSKVEDEWKEAEKEYMPHEVEFSAGRKILEADQETGLRSRLVPVGDAKQNWRSKNADPTLLTKIQSALSIIIDQNPEAMLIALGKKFDKTTDLAYSLWKRNWEITGAKDVLKLFVFNLFLYGWAVGRSYPRIIKYKKSVLRELDTKNPENNVYEEQENIIFNDVFRQNLNPFRTWIDETTTPYDHLSMNDNYFEIDYPYDIAKNEFGGYKNFDFVSRDSRVVYDTEEEMKDDTKLTRKDIVTIGFYENKLKDLYVIRAPKQKIVLYHGPLSNDDGVLSLWHTLCILRSAKSPYGIGLWRVIRDDKQLYDRMTNMTMDQLVLSIHKMFFYTGTSNVLGDGQVAIKPGKGEQIVNGSVQWLEVPTPGREAWVGLKYLKSKIYDNFCITPTLEGEVTGKTLGETLHAKEAALKRLKVPLENIADAIEQDAYLTLSWMSQIYSTPEIKEFADEESLMRYEEENGTKHDQLFEGETDDEGNSKGFTATFLPQLSLHLEDREGKLVESSKSRFFQVGKDISASDLKWRGIFKVIRKSILAPSAELEKQRKMELFNILVPLLPADPRLFAKPASQIIKINEEDARDWLPDIWLQFLEKGEPLFINPAQQMMQGMQGGEQTMQGGGQTMQGQAGTQPNEGGQTVLPQNQITAPVGPDLMGAIQNQVKTV